MRRPTSTNRLYILVALIAVALASTDPTCAIAQRAKRKTKQAGSNKTIVHSIVVKQSFENEAATKIFNEAVSLSEAKRYTEAAAKFEETLPILLADNDQKGQVTVLNNVGVSYALGGNHAKAGEYYEKSYELAKVTSDDAAQASVLYNLGVSAYKLDRDPALILDYFTRALAIYQKLGNHTGEADTLFNMGEVYQWNGESQKAREYYKKSLEARTQ